MTETPEISASSTAIWDCGSPLYDSYELVSLNHLIERHLMAMPSLAGSSKRLTSKCYYQYDVQNLGPVTDHTRGNSCSLMNMLCEFAGRMLWKRRIGVGQRKEKPKRLKIGPSGFFYRFGFNSKK